MSALTSYCVHSAALHGVEALPVTIEVSISQTIPGITIVGLPDASVHEARYRVRSALNKYGFELPRVHFTVNLAPSELRKSGAGFDLGIAVAILACTGQIPLEGLDECLFVGELGLEGDVSGVRGLVAYDLLAQEQHLTLVTANAAIPTKSNARACENIGELLGGVRELPPVRGFAADEADALGSGMLDFADVVDQEMAKRAFVIAAAGNHGLLMVGPPGAGKSMMAKRMPTILSKLDENERAEATLIHSVAGQSIAGVQAGERPFRSPHHAISLGGMIGGGRPVTPGEVSLAHGGVLFLDELPEFGPHVLQSLRQPMEDGVVSIVRVEGTYLFPCSFMLVAAANPCPCGYLGDPDHTCTCTQARIQTYQSRIGGPLMDRIDVLVDVARPSPSRIISGEGGTSSAQMAEEVAAAREFALWRKARGEGAETGRSSGTGRSRSKAARSGSKSGGAGSVAAQNLDAEARSTLEGMARRLVLGGRNIVRIARVARTIADLAEEEKVLKDHVIEACAFRTRSSL